MADSVVKSISVPAAGAENPATLATANLIPLRVMVRNVGLNTVFLAHKAAAIQGADAATASDVYELPPGYADVFVLTMRQGLWAVGIGAGGRLSVAQSDAFPVSHAVEG